jgi:hypothetical protein
MCSMVTAAVSTADGCVTAEVTVVVHLLSSAPAMFKNECQWAFVEFAVALKFWLHCHRLAV